MTVFFFFSSRRRHTRFSRDWSSDVCSSDLHPNSRAGHRHVRGPHRIERGHQPHRSWICRRPAWGRSEEHTSELQSRENLVCRLLLEKKKKKTNTNTITKTKNQTQPINRTST